MTEKAPEPTIRDLMVELRRLAEAVEQRPREPAILTPDELHAVTGYKIASRQLEKLHRLGFSRARIGMGGRIVTTIRRFVLACTRRKGPDYPR